MGGSQGALARKLAEAKKQNSDSENTTTDDVGKENVTSEEDKMRRDFEYMIKNDAYSLLADEEDEGVASVAAGGSSSSRANTPPPPKLYVGDDFPLTEAQLREYCITPSGEPSTQCGVGKYKVLIIDPRPNSAFQREAFSNVISTSASLPKEANYVFISPTPCGQLRQMMKKALKKNKAGTIDNWIGDGYEDINGRIQVYSTGEDGGGIYTTLGVAGEGRIFSLWVIAYNTETRKVKVLNQRQESLVSLTSLS
eukprot:CAMPEP_0118651436 /NCGR_PEP_ID=MMETSP0785-20121206/10786_1 /TAXON_ID=91992 /ORGANISM="Bolidomonas pacifica, Strain CCMP 1866" /LENGTH=252 /DNA_ID=CAMNT_0006543891 /DNA_START=188 /DNA_END=942 /DNA_ORIENTATION=-